MGKYDHAMCSFLSDNGRFADLFNGAVFGGEKVLRADALVEGAERYAWTGLPKGKRGKIPKRRIATGISKSTSKKAQGFPWWR